VNPPKMPIHIGDYQRDTGHLGAKEHGAYLLLMFHYWSTGGLPDNDNHLATIARLSRSEWSRHKATLQAFFKEGWKHSRIDYDLAKALGISESASKAGKASGRSRSVKPTLNGRSSSAEPTLEPYNHSKKDSEAIASGAGAPTDHRNRLFNEGLKKLADMTGKGPDACRSFVGKCLKAASDDAIIVIGLIDEAERNQVVDPSAWIAARLKGPSNGKPQSPIIQAADDLRRKIASFDGPPGKPDGVRGGAGEAAPGLLSNG
jgi:uncharacterized protein YdaU (DUF1376 family)